MDQQFDTNVKKKLMACFYESEPDDRLHSAYDQLLKSNKQLNAVKSNCITSLFNDHHPQTVMREQKEETNACVMLHADILRGTDHDPFPVVVRTMRFKLAQEPVNTVKQMQELSPRVLGTLIQKSDFWEDSESLQKVVYDFLYNKTKSDETWRPIVNKCTELLYNNEVVLKCGELNNMMVQNKCDMEENFEQRQHCSHVTQQLPYRVWMLTIAKKCVTENLFLKVKIVPCSNLRASLVACSMHMSGFTQEKLTGRFDKHCHFRLHPAYGMHPADFATMAIPHMRTHAQKIAELHFKCLLANTICFHAKSTGKPFDAGRAQLDLQNHDETSLQLEAVRLYGRLNAQQMSQAASMWNQGVQAGDVKVRCVHGAERSFVRDELHTDVMMHTLHEIQTAFVFNDVRVSVSTPVSISIFGTCFISK
jgi:hypothetical protein